MKEWFEGNDSDPTAARSPDITRTQDRRKAEVSIKKTRGSASESPTKDTARYEPSKNAERIPSARKIGPFKPGSRKIEVLKDLQNSGKLATKLRLTEPPPLAERPHTSPRFFFFTSQHLSAKDTIITAQSHNAYSPMSLDNRFKQLHRFCSPHQSRVLF